MEGVCPKENGSAALAPSLDAGLPKQNGEVGVSGIWVLNDFAGAAGAPAGVLTSGVCRLFVARNAVVVVVVDFDEGAVLARG